MNLFVCFRSIDDYEGVKVINRLKNKSQNSLVILEETDRNPKWKKNVSVKFSISHFVVFYKAYPGLLWEDCMEKEG